MYIVANPHEPVHPVSDDRAVTLVYLPSFLYERVTMRFLGDAEGRNVGEGISRVPLRAPVRPSQREIYHMLGCQLIQEVRLSTSTGVGEFFFKRIIFLVTPPPFVCLRNARLALKMRIYADKFSQHRTIR